jgi:GH15 family glucan-1,4-alpha-glucosidase
MAYQPIENYGIIGDLRSTALVGTDGSIDWLCLPRFDSPSVFAAILDDEKGGCFKIAPMGDGVSRKQFYWPDTNVLVTRFFTPDGVGEVVDYMPVTAPAAAQAHGHERPRQLIRRVRVTRGVMTFRMECSPAFDYARQEHETEITRDGACFYSPQLSLGLATYVPVEQHGNAAAVDFTLKEDESTVFALRQIKPGEGCGLSISELAEQELFMQTVEYWRRWLSKCTYTGRWREMVYRSAHFKKLVRNGIEFGMPQAIGEGVDLLQHYGGGSGYPQGIEVLAPRVGDTVVVDRPDGGGLPSRRRDGEDSFLCCRHWRGQLARR